MSSLPQRDAFWNRVFDIAKKDRNIMVITADMGAPSLDQFRKDLPAQFVNVGIAEQNAVTIAAGLALSGKKVFTYAIAPFITLRCLEQIRVESAIMGLPITFVGVGAGFGYPDSGPTHHMLEDIAIMRALPNIIIHSISDSVMAAAIGERSCGLKIANYVRLDRQLLPDLYDSATDFSPGLTVLKEGTDRFLVATGSMTTTALAIARRLEDRGLSLGVIDVHTFPLNAELFLRIVQSATKLVSIEEHFLAGGLGSAVCEVLNDNNRGSVQLARIGLSMEQGFTGCYHYGGRDVLRKQYGLDDASLEQRIVRHFA